MLQYSPDQFQWFLLVGSAPLGAALFLIGAVILMAMAVEYLMTRKKPRYLSLGVPGVLVLALGIALPYFASPANLTEGISAQLQENAKFEDVGLLHLETVSESPLTDGSVVFIGTAKDVDGDPRQFRYTQYADFGIYEMIGFDKPAVNLRDESFRSTEQGIERYLGDSAVPDSDPTEAPAETPSEAPSEAPAQ